ncbi:uncharacterized protein B0H64DRAFT_468940 [Chaetomium fimeti]|uniref:RNase H type-1 domain-containing protein n=1 Tax=Chaetomium fimeti TaxID=1854472 RepID=A0AAE0H8N5_9PEZI|nr:hypothetical protein B0H64DRAFT_468940 [Chaetomium fimeti]
MSNEHQNRHAGVEVPQTIQGLGSESPHAVAAINSTVNKIATSTFKRDQEDFDNRIHTITSQRIISFLTLRTCMLNFPPQARVLPISAAELLDLKATPRDPKTLHPSAVSLSKFCVGRHDNQSTTGRKWMQRTMAYIDRICSRMWRPAKRERQDIRDQNITTADELTQLYVDRFPDEMDKDRAPPASRKWEVLLPRLVTFVLCETPEAAPSPPSEALAAPSSTASPLSPHPSTSSTAAVLQPKSKPPGKRNGGRHRPTRKGTGAGTGAGKLEPNPPTPPTTALNPPPITPTAPAPPSPQKRATTPVMRYLATGERDRQTRAEFCAALTAAFAPCERVRAPDVGGRWEAHAAHVRRRFVGRFFLEEGGGGVGVGGSMGDGLKGVGGKREVGKREVVLVGGGVEGDEQGEGSTEAAAGNKDKGKGREGENPERRWTLVREIDAPEQQHEHVPIEEPERTMLVFAAGVCVRDRGGVGLVTKDTTHFHEYPEWQRVHDAEARLSNAAAEQSLQPADVRLVGLCAAALKKPMRGYGRSVQQPGEYTMACSLLGGTYSMPLERLPLDIDPGQFGFVDSRYRPWWKTENDKCSDEEYVKNYKRVRDMQAEGGINDQTASGSVDIGKDAKGDGKKDDRGEDKNNDEALMGEVEKKAVRREPVYEPVFDSDSELEAEPAETSQQAMTTGTGAGSTNVPAGPEQESTSQEPAPKTRLQATPNRVAARALLAAVQITPFDFGHCARLVIATDSEHAIEMATNRLQNMLERGLPFRTVRGQPVEDEDIWWAFAGAVKDLAYQGVEVAIVRCREGEGIELPISDAECGVEGASDERPIFGMTTAISVARHAAKEAVRRDIEARKAAKKGKMVRGGDDEFERVMGLFV